MHGPEAVPFLAPLLPCCCVPFVGMVGILLLAFWIWMIVDCATNEPDVPGSSTKIVWILVVVLLGWIGALIYYFARRPQRLRTAGK